MLKKTITYTDLNGTERKEDFYFDLSRPEIVKLLASKKGGYDVELKSIASDAEGNGARIIEFFEDLIKRSYGEKSEDGRRFMKSPEISKSFFESPAYEVLFDELVTDADAGAKFVNAVLRVDKLKIANVGEQEKTEEA